MVDTLLLIEDQPLLGEELSRHYRRAGWEVVLAPTLAEARRMLFDDGLGALVVLSDMSLPDGNALGLLEAARAAGMDNEWVFLTGYGRISDSVRGLRLGAYDFLEKPCEQERLDLVVAGAARSARAHRRLSEQGEERYRRFAPESFIGSSPEAQRVRELLRKLAAVPFTALLIGGETGTGKGLAARSVHYGGLRKHGPLVEVNCAALPRELLESELFGHEAGAFTGAKGRRRGLLEQAHGGTLFLDEIGEMQLDLQAKLLKAIEEHRFRRLGGQSEVSVDTQVIASSNRDLAEMVQERRFRSDLYHRLKVFSIELPPLRARRQDLDDLVPLIVAEFNAKADKAVRVIPPDAWSRLFAHDWPGNVRELRNVIERCVLFSDTGILPVQWICVDPAGEVRRGAGARNDGQGLYVPLDGTLSLDEIDREIIRAALDRTGHSATAAARLLGSTRETFRYRVQKYGLKSADD